MNPSEMKTLRSRMGLTQQEFGERLGLAPKFARNQVSAMERGTVPISRRTAAVFELLLKERPRRKAK